MSIDLRTPPTMRAIVKAMTTAELAACAQDVISWQDRGVLADGPLHRMS